MTKRPRRLSLFLPFLKDGGVERAFLNLAEAFLDDGIEVDLVVGGKADGPYSSQIPHRVHVIEFNARRWKWTPALAAYLRRRPSDGLISAFTPANFCAIVARRIARVSTPVSVGVHISVGLTKSTSRLRAPLRPAAYRAFYRQADSVVAVSQGVADDLLRIGIPQRKVDLIYNPVVTPSLLQSSVAAVDHPFFRDASPPVILAVGRLHKQKDFAMLLRAFALLRAKTAARLVILGEGPEREPLMQLARQLGVDQDCSFPGFAANPYAYMRRAAVLAVSSEWEGFCYVIAEAMAVGTPVVSTDCPSGPGEILEKGKWGRLVPVGDPAALAGGLLDTLDSPPDAEPLRLRAADFRADIAARKYIAALSK
jgi:glycosyltransferase involved in cell wall biosynthesis